MKIKFIDVDTKKAEIRLLPQSWQEINMLDRLDYVHLLLSHEPTTARLKILPHLLKLPKNLIFYGLSLENQTALVQKLEFLNLEPSSTPIVRKFSHKTDWCKFGKWFELPDVDFEKGTAIQFAIALDHYTAYGKSGDRRDLLRLVAALATEKGVKIDDNTDFEKLIKNLNNLSMAKCIIVLRYFEGVKQMVHEMGVKCKLWQNEDENTEGEGSVNVNLFGLRSVFRSLADHDPTRYDVICNRKFLEILQILIERKAAQDYIESKMPKPTPNNEDNNGD